MEYTKLKLINNYKSENINPAKTPDTIFEMYSVPIFETGHPEYLRGDAIASNKAVVKKNDILLCKINPRINRVWVVTDESEFQNIASSEWIVVRNEEYNPEFLAWYFRTPKFQKLMTSEVTGIGGSLTRAQPKCVAEYPVPVLDRNQQDEIVDILNKCKFIIDARKQELEEMDELIKARFVELFGDTVINPKGWTEHRLDEYITFLTSGSRGWAQYFTDEKNELFITIKNVKNNHITLDDIQYVDAPENKEAERTKVKTGDLLISITADLGRTGVVDDSIADRGAYINQHLSLVRLDQDKINPLYVSYFLETSGGKRQFERKNQNGVKAGLNFEAIKSLKIFVPPIEMQEQYLDFVKQVDKSKVAVQKALDEAQLLFDSLMQDYFG